MYRFNDANGSREELEIPAEYKDKAESMHSELAERTAEADEPLMEKFFENGASHPMKSYRGLIIGFRKCEIMPLVIVSGKKDIGVKHCGGLYYQMLLRLINSWHSFLRDEIPQALRPVPVHKTTREQHLGDVAFFRVMSGKITESFADLINTNNGGKERISGLFVAAGKKREKVTELVAGDMGCTVKLKSARSNHTLNGNGKRWNLNPSRSLPPNSYGYQSQIRKGR